MKQIYRVTVNYLEPTEVYGMVIASSEEDAVVKFKEATGFDSAPPEFNMEITGIELVEENVPENVTTFEEYRAAQNKKVLN